MEIKRFILTSLKRRAATVDSFLIRGAVSRAKGSKKYVRIIVNINISRYKTAGHIDGIAIATGSDQASAI